MQITGQELKITQSSFADAKALEKAIGRALKGNGSISLPGSLEDEATPDTMSTIIDAVLSVAISDEVERALFKCAERALVGTEKVDQDFFEKAENREHFYPIMIEIIKVNVAPFFKNLLSQFGDLIPNLGNFLKSK